MKTTTAILAAGLSLCFSVGRAQNAAVSYQAATMPGTPAIPATPAYESDTAIATRFALQFADSLVRAHFYQEWKTYTALTQANAIKYYGGPEGFRTHVTNLYFRNEPKGDEKPEKVKMISLMNDGLETWQCVIEKVRQTWINNRKAIITSYLVGESRDNGLTWRFIDASHNTLPNVIYVMPTIFGKLAVPEGKIEYKDAL